MNAMLAPVSLLPPDSREVMRSAAVMVVGCAAVQQLSVPLARWIYPAVRDPKRERGAPGGDLWAADAICLLFFTVAMLPPAFGAIVSLHGSVESRWNGICFWSIQGCVLLCVRMLCHMPFLVWKGMNSTRKRLLVHHTVVITVYWAGLMKGTMHFWGALAGLCEFSNIFLAYFELVKCYTDVNKVKQTWLYKMNSCLLVLAYVCCRLVMFPAILAGLVYDAHTQPELTYRSLSKAGVAECVMMPLALCCIWAMSAFEFQSIFPGMFKAFSIEKVSKQKALGVAILSGSVGLLCGPWIFSV